MLIASIVLIVIGILIIMSGYSIRKKGNTSFLAGNNDVFIPKNEAKLAERISWIVIFFGIETIVFPLVFYFIKIVEGYHYAILAVIHLLAIFVLMFIDQMGGRD